MVEWYGEFDLQANAANLAELASAMGDFIERYSREDPVRRYGQWWELYVEPARRRMFIVEIEPSRGGAPFITLRIPVGHDKRRMALVSSDWQPESSRSGTKYFTRHLAGPQTEPSRIAATIHAAYRTVYGERARDLSWKLSIMILRAPTTDVARLVARH